MDKYQALASDSLKGIFNDQREYNKKFPGSVNTDNFISLKYDLKDLHLKSIPKFRIKNRAVTAYNSPDNIEDFIEFSEPYKYQDALIYDDKQNLLTVIEVPNFYYELGRIHNPSLDYRYEKDDYAAKVIDQFLSFPDSYKHKAINRMLMERPNNFFFTIFGIRDVIFEVDHKSNLVFANWLGVGSKNERIPASLYVMKYLGEQYIKQIASGNYDGEITSIKAEEKEGNLQRQFFLKVKS